MTQQDIILTLCESMLENVDVENLTYKKEVEETKKWAKILNAYMKNDKKFQEILSRYEVAEGQYLTAVSEFCYREGFLCGARLALEICGYTNKNE